MSQDGLIDKIIAQLVLDDRYVKVKWTPANVNPFVKDENGLGASG